MSKNKIIEAFKQDLRDYGPPFGHSKASWAKAWVAELENAERHDIVGELIRDAIGAPGSYGDVAGWGKETDEMVTEAIVKLGKRAER